MIESFLKHLRHEKRLSGHTLTAYQNDLRQFHQFLSDHHPSVDISATDHITIRLWIVYLIEQGLEPVSVNRKVACLRRFYKYLLTEGVIVTDPMSRVQALKTKKRLPHFVQEEHMVKLLDNLDFPDTFEGLRDRLILEVLYGTGIRLSELIQLRDENIDLRQRTMKVLGKRNKERVIPFPLSLVSLIEQYRLVRNRDVGSKRGTLFVRNNGEPCYPTLVYKVVRRHLAALPSLEQRSPHVLRHTYATHLLDRGAELNAVKDLLGHTSLAATQVYTHNSLDKLRKVFEQAHPKA